MPGRSRPSTSSEDGNVPSPFRGARAEPRGGPQSGPDELVGRQATLVRAPSTTPVVREPSLSGWSGFARRAVGLIASDTYLPVTAEA